MESTSKIVSIGNMGQARVWEGRTPAGVQFLALVTKIGPTAETPTPASIAGLVSEVSKSAKEPEPATLAALQALGIV
jgi:hypothetical protein